MNAKTLAIAAAVAFVGWKLWKARYGSMDSL